MAFFTEANLVNVQEDYRKLEKDELNEYDISRGATPGKFREHFTLTCIAANNAQLEILKKELQRRDKVESWPVWNPQQKAKTLPLSFVSVVAWFVVGTSKTKSAPPSTKSPMKRQSSVSTLPSHLKSTKGDAFFS